MSARQDSPPLQIDGQRYTLVCGDRFRDTADQLIEATAALDALFARYHLPPAAHFLADFRLCRIKCVS